MPRLNKVAKCYIDNNPTLSAKKLAKDLAIDVKDVEKYLKQNVVAVAKDASDEPISAETHVKLKESTVLGQLARNKERGVVAMTQSGSNAGDERRRHVSKNIQRDCVTTIYTNG